MAKGMSQEFFTKEFSLKKHRRQNEKMEIKAIIFQPKLLCAENSSG